MKNLTMSFNEFRWCETDVENPNVGDAGEKSHRKTLRGQNLREAQSSRGLAKICETNYQRLQYILKIFIYNKRNFSDLLTSYFTFNLLICNKH